MDTAVHVLARSGFLLSLLLLTVVVQGTLARATLRKAKKGVRKHMS